MNLLDRDFWSGDPYLALAELRHTDPVHHGEETGLWALLRYADVAWAEKQPELLSNAGGSRPRMLPQPYMIDSDDPLHNRRRRLVYKGFTPRHVAEWEPYVRNVTASLIDAVAPRGECDLVRDLAAPLPMAVIGEMLGVPERDRGRLQWWSDQMLAGADGPENVTPDVLQAASDYYDYAGRTISERRDEPREDIISILVHAEIDGERLSHEELMAEALLLLVGGNETTRHVISGGMEALMRHPGQGRRLLDDPSLLPSAVEECLRWVTPIIDMCRTATRDVEIAGRTIPAGDQVLLVYASANRDEDVFEAPDDFDIGRDPNPHLAFGLGTHFCLGASLARLEIKVMLSEILRRLPDMEVADPDAPLERTRSSFIRGLTSLPVVFARTS